MHTTLSKCRRRREYQQKLSNTSSSSRQKWEVTHDEATRNHVDFSERGKVLLVSISRSTLWWPQLPAITFSNQHPHNEAYFLVAEARKKCDMKYVCKREQAPRHHEGDFQTGVPFKNFYKPQRPSNCVHSLVWRARFTRAFYGDLWSSQWSQPEELQHRPSANQQTSKPV